MESILRESPDGALCAQGPSCPERKPKQNKAQPRLSSPLRVARVQRTGEEGARHGTVLNSFTRLDKTNEQLKADKKQTARRDRDPSTFETKRAVPTAGFEEAKTEYTAAATAVMSNTKSRAAFESQSSDHIAKSDVAEETMSAMVKLAKDPLEPHDIYQHTEECHLITRESGVHGETSSRHSGGAEGTKSVP